MSSASAVRPLKRRRDEVEEKIESLSKVINTMTGSKKHFLQAKLKNIKLKKQKLIALSFCRSHESTKHSLVDEFEMMIAENDINIDIESIRRCKKFKRTENRYMERLFREPCARKSGACYFSPSDASTSCDTSAEIPSGCMENGPHICKQNISRIHITPLPMCHKSTITDPVHILDTKEIIQPTDRNISPMKDTTGTVEENTSPLRESIASSENKMSPVPLKEITSPTKENKELFKEDLSQMGENTLLQSEGSCIQSKWFESSFEMEQFLNEKAQVSETSGIECFRENSASTIAENEYKHKTNQCKSRSQKVEESSLALQIPKQISTATENLLCEGKSENATNVPSSKSQAVALPEATMTLAEMTGTLPEATVVQNTTKAVTLPNYSNVALPEADVVFPETNHSHRLIVDLFGTYKKIYSSEKVRNSVKILHSTQNENNIHNDGNIKKILASVNDSKCNEKSAKKYDCKENYKNSAEILQQSIELSTKIGEKSCETQHMATNNSQRKSKSKYSSRKSQCLYAKSKDLSTNFQDSFAKSQVLSTKSQNIPAKSQNLSSSQDRYAKSKDLSAKFQDSFAKSQVLSTNLQDLPHKSMDFSTINQDLFAKSQNWSTSQDQPKSKDLSSKSNRSIKKSHKTSKNEPSSKENTKKQKSYISTSNEQAALYMTELSKNAMEKNAVKTISQEDLINDLFMDLMASRQVKPGTDSSPDRTVRCHECGLVYEGHMCAYTIRKILEQC